MKHKGLTDTEECQERQRIGGQKKWRVSPQGKKGNKGGELQFGSSQQAKKIHFAFKKKLGRGEEK